MVTVTLCEATRINGNQTSQPIYNIMEPDVLLFLRCNLRGLSRENASRDQADASYELLSARLPTE